MTITLELQDIDGQPLELGDRVFGFAQSYAELSRKGGGFSGECLEIEEDRTRPMPVKDVPLFVGAVAWCSEMLNLVIDVEEIFADWQLPPSRISMGGGHYVYQKDAA